MVRRNDVFYNSCMQMASAGMVTDKVLGLAQVQVSRAGKLFREECLINRDYLDGAFA